MPLYIQDTADAVLERKSDKFVIATGTTQTVTLKQKVDEETVKGGIGNAAQFTIKSNKELEITMEDALFNFQWLAATHGVKVVNDKLVVKRTEVAEVEEGGKVTSVNSKLAGELVVIDTYGKNVKGKFTAGSATISDLSSQVGKNVTIVTEEEVQGEKVSIRADRFAEKYRLQLFTYAYDQDTEAIAKDVFLTFDNVSPSSEFDLKLKAGDPLSPELQLKATANPKTKEIGSWMIVDHKEDAGETNSGAVVAGRRSEESGSHLG